MEEFFIRKTRSLCPNVARHMVGYSTLGWAGREFSYICMRAGQRSDPAKDVAQKHSENIWSDIGCDQFIILLSAEMLPSTRFLFLVKSEMFQTRLIAICVDEVHLLHTW